LRRASPAGGGTLVGKAEKAFAIEGAAFINVLTPCPLGWMCEPDITVEIAMLAADTLHVAAV